MDLSTAHVVETLATLPPVVTQPKAHPSRSAHYVHINTRSVISEMQRHGFAVASVQVTRPRRMSADAARRDALFARHQVILRNAALKPIGGVLPEFRFVNSHDGSSAASVLYGAFRFVCSNGLVVGTTFGAARVRHVGDPAAELIDRIRKLAANTAPLFDKIEQWSALRLSAPRVQQFASLASTLRWGDPHRFEPRDVLTVRRAEDDDDTLWAVFNRVQENTVRGGLVGLSASGRRATSRPLSDIVATNTYNAQLWQLAEEFAANI